MDNLLVDQVEAKVADINEVSINEIKDLSTLELADVVDAIDQASRQEIDSMTQGFDGIKASIQKAFNSNLSSKTRAKSDVSSVKKAGRETSIDSKGVKQAKIKQEYATNTHKISVKGAENKQVEKVTNKAELSPPPVARPPRELELVEATVESVTSNPSQNNSITAVNNLGGEQSSVTTKAAKPKETTPVKASLVPAESMSQYALGEDGRLRNENGKFASKAERKQYDKQQMGDNGGSSAEGEKEPEKQTSILKQILFSTGKLALLGAGSMARSGDKEMAKHSAGLAMGGSYFLAAKEIGELIGGVKESLSESGINSFSDVVKKAKESASKANESVKGFGSKVVAMVAAVQVSATDAVEEVKPKKESVSKPSLFERMKAKLVPAKATDTAEANPKKSSLFERIKNSYANEMEKAKAKTADTTKATEASGKTKPFTQDKAAPRWLKSRGNPIFRFFSKLNPTPTKVDDELLKVNKAESKLAESRHQAMLVALSDIDDSVKGIRLDGGGGGLLGDALDLQATGLKSERASALLAEHPEQE